MLTKKGGGGGEASLVRHSLSSIFYQCPIVIDLDLVLFSGAIQSNFSIRVQVWRLSSAGGRGALSLIYRLIGFIHASPDLVEPFRFHLGADCWV